jgi:hypothetical protein
MSTVGSVSASFARSCREFAVAAGVPVGVPAARAEQATPSRVTVVTVLAIDLET